MDGSAVSEPQNVEVIIGTPISFVLSNCGVKDEAKVDVYKRQALRTARK